MFDHIALDFCYNRREHVVIAVRVDHGSMLPIVGRFALQSRIHRVEGPNMSRAYRVKVRESLSRVVRAEDRVSTTLELLEILPCEEMAGLLRDELARRGFEARGDRLVRDGDGVVIEVDPTSGEVSVRSEISEEHTDHAEMQGHADEDRGRKGLEAAEAALRGQLRHRLEKEAEAKEAGLRERATARLESGLEGLRSELDQVVNRVTADALKRKAARIGRIKEMTEDPVDGSLTIVLEV